MDESVGVASAGSQETAPGAHTDEKSGNNVSSDEKKDTHAPVVASSDEKSGNMAPALSLQEQVHNAAEFGWLVAELLGRCFLLLDTKPPHLNWSGEELVMLQGLLTPREKMRALTAHMGYLAETLGIGSLCTIDHRGDAYEGKPFVDAVRDAVKKLCNGDFENGETFESVRGIINERLFFWDLKINDILQEKPAVVEKAYMVGYCLGGLRWWYGLPGFKLDSTFKSKVLQYLPVLGPYLPQFASPALVRCVGPWWDALDAQAVAGVSAIISDSQQPPILTLADLQNVQNQVEALQTQIAALRTGNLAPAEAQKQIEALQAQITALQKRAGLVASTDARGQAVSVPATGVQKQIEELQTQADALRKQVDAWQADGLAPANLQKQGHIWYSLIAGECDALSYVDPTIRNRPYIWQVFLAAWPFFVVSVFILLAILAAVVYVIITYRNQIVQGAAALIGALAATWIGQTIQKNAGNLLQSALADADTTIKSSYGAVTTVEGSIKVSYLDKVWNASLQEAVNKAIFVAPPAPRMKK
ncbi:MAG TPA: hypothetical protein VKV40_06640 [Ktedonobacteraceae bacterium]|nr:hypothetical protein [Ktedonobacteraceae bacterium]